MTKLSAAPKPFYEAVRHLEEPGGAPVMAAVCRRLKNHDEVNVDDLSNELHEKPELVKSEIGRALVELNRFRIPLLSQEYAGIVTHVDNDWVRIRFVDDEATEREIPKSQFRRRLVKPNDRVLLTSVLMFDLPPDPAMLSAEFAQLEDDERFERDRRPGIFP